MYSSCLAIMWYGKILKIRPGAYIFQRPFLRGLFLIGRAYILRGLSTEGNLRFKINWASLIVGGKFTIFALFYCVFEGDFPSTSPQGAYIWRGDLMEGFFRYRFRGLIFGGAYIRNFTVVNLKTLLCRLSSLDQQSMNQSSNQQQIRYVQYSTNFFSR